MRSSTDLDLKILVSPALHLVFQVQVCLLDVTWPSLLPISSLCTPFAALEHTTFTSVPRTRFRHLFVSANDCTANIKFHTTLQITYCPVSPLAQLPALERDAILALAGAVPGQVIGGSFDPSPDSSLDAEHERSRALVSKSCIIDCPSDSPVRIFNRLICPADKAVWLDLDMYILTTINLPTRPSFTHVIALLTIVDPSSVAFAFRNLSLRLSIDRLPSLRILTLWFSGTFSLVESATRADPTLRTFLSGNQEITYRFLCRRSEERPFTQVRSVDYDELIEIDPMSLNPIGRIWSFSDAKQVLPNMVKSCCPELMPQNGPYLA